ncbi:endonuclease/exonuclease/phosphatase family protein [Corynebacterium aquilae]|uniref:endonuclease/exonuclease/phosphatase family protein n=1 Tax=Corynebacterium aquilae TaxID=203263 RepID=UPI001474EC47|nr:endonuclease/exonuclease/phosphatase family protein [Corynebacterium aquilae]
MFTTHNADIAVIPEWGFAPGENDSTAALLAEAGLRPAEYSIDQTEFFGSGARPVTVIRRGAYRSMKFEQHCELMTWGTLKLSAPDTPTAPTFIGIHTMAPVPYGMEQWRGDLQEISDLVAKAEGPTIVMGDFNATNRHGPMATLGGVSDALDAVSPLNRGTWDANRPKLARTVIDHVLYSTQDFTVTKALVRPGEKSDHAMVVVSFAENGR